MIKNLLYTIIIILHALPGIAQTVPLSFDVENRGKGCTVTAGALVNHPKLPDPFSFTGGGRVSTFDEWSCRRNEIKADIEKYEIGVKPNRPTDITATYSGTTLTVTVKESGRTLTLTSNFSVPAGNGPHPIVIGMNSGTGTLSASLFNGVVQVPFNHNQVATYSVSGGKDLNAPFYKFYPNLTSAGDYCAWSWGVSRLIDGLEIVATQLKLDMSRICVTGCSYAGKMALFAGAFDERIALTIAQESGGGGINSWRLSQDYTTRTGTDIEKINNTSGTWFMNSMRSLNPYNLPHDHHELVAMIAPRAFLALGNPPYAWLGDESGYKSCMAALEVWKSMGVPDRFGFDFTGGHDHCTAASSQNTSSTAFIEKFLRNKTANTTIRVNPNQSGFDLNYSSTFTGTTPTLTFNLNTPKVTITSPTQATAEIAQVINIGATVTDANNDVTKVEFFVDNVKIGEDGTSPYTFTWTAATAGDHIISVKATDAQANTGSATLTIKVQTPQGPYNGVTHQVPGIIQLEAYDAGGNNVAYYDNSAGSAVTPVVNFRTNEDVDIENCTDVGGGYNIGYAMAGEWLEYSVNVQRTGAYDLELRVACNGSGRTISVSMDGTNIANNVAIPNTAGWQNWQTIRVSNISLTAGQKIMRVTMGATDYINLNYVEFKAIMTGLQPAKLTGVELYPNPFSSEGLQIRKEGEFRYRITDMSGAILEEGEVNDVQVIGNNLSLGIYILSVENSNGLYTYKIIKQ